MRQQSAITKRTGRNTPLTSGLTLVGICGNYFDTDAMDMSELHRLTSVFLSYSENVAKQNQVRHCTLTCYETTTANYRCCNLIRYYY